MPGQLEIPVTEASQVGDVRRTAVRLAQNIGLSEERRSDIAIVANELASNLHRHAKGGRVWLQTVQTNGRPVVELIAVDSGPGMADLQRCLRDGYSSGGTAGTGFGAVRRLADDFDVHSMPGKGTVVMARFGSPAPAPPRFIFGAVSLCAPHETVCGDSWRVVERGMSLALLVADGLGHGPLASEAAEKAAGIFEGEPFADGQQYFAAAHRALAHGRGAAVARATISGTGRVEYSSVGNIAAYMVGTSASKGLPAQNGTIGAEFRRDVDVQTYEWSDEGVLLLHSDGLLTRWSLDRYPGLIVRHPSLIAAVLCRDFLRGRDDATVVVVRRCRMEKP